MAYLKMSLANAIFTTLLSVSYVTGTIDATVGNHAELAANHLADVAHTGRFEMDIRSSAPEWYRAGMQVFAYRNLRFYWDKTDLTWDLTKSSTVLDDATVIAAMEAAFSKWAAVTPLTFRRESSEKPDIRVAFVEEENEDYDSCVVHKRDENCKDDDGVTIQYTNTKNWMGASDEGQANFQFFAVYEVGHALGLGESDFETAVMAGPDNPVAFSTHTPQLADDDVAGIQEKYGGPLGSGIRSVKRSGETRKMRLWENNRIHI